jgi:tRNA(fMet)-specific endonuclease VapC
MLYVLDSDHMTLFLQGDPSISYKLDQIGLDNVAVTVITVEEILRGWLGVIRAASSPQKDKKLCWGYLGLRIATQELNRFSIFDFTESAKTKWSDLRHQGIRIGTQDLRIAAVALVNDLAVVTRNQRDFSQVPGLRLEDWTK